MADAGDTSPGRSRDRHVPSYEAPTTPMPVVRDEDSGDDATVTPRVPRRSPGGSAGRDVPVSRGPAGGTASPIRAGGTVSRGPAGGTASGGRAGGAAGDAPGAPLRVGGPPAAVREPADAAEPAAPPVPARGGGGMAARIADIPVRTVYSALAAVATVFSIIGVFALFSGDEPADPVPQRRPAEEAAPAAPAAPSAPAASPAAELPRLPGAIPLAALPGTASPVTGTVVDTRAGVAYARLGGRWKDGAGRPFSAGMRVGGARPPRTLAVSFPLPGKAPAEAPDSDADHRALAVRAVRWALRNHYPDGSELVWTASQRHAGGRGWVLGYRVDYEIDGRRRSSQGALALLGTARAKPAVFLVTVPDGRRELWADIAPLVASVRPL
ncbi:hypothetical protein GCM10010466_06010 [Planomonospora alba]|uniref:Uncharacterized protein n=1 Tax=Planomonospora alba TaxID=161354 RepID=A0ABP6MKN8_9ACTN